MTIVSFINASTAERVFHKSLDFYDTILSIKHNFYIVWNGI